MDLKQVTEMVAAVCTSRTVTEMTLQEGSTRLTIRRALAMASVPVPPVPTPAPPAPVVEAVVVRSPLVGIFHRRGPEAAAAVAVGTGVREGEVLGAIESMRMMYEVAAGAGGTVTEVLVEDGQPVEYGQELFRIQPAG